MFTFLKRGEEWKVKPTTEKKLSEYVKRGNAMATPLSVTIKRMNEMLRGWIS